MATRKKTEDSKLTRSQLDSQVKAFLKSGGTVTKIPRGKSSQHYSKPAK